ncbi:hypothetical protein Q9L58_000859 [Maublancomyces gigas]|uniref:DUF4048 domain-containing protein n=1 Tax=Discina gigas TaxID=1032678 RepID=A0ABR3GWR4_9PEZI
MEDIASMHVLTDSANPRNLSCGTTTPENLPRAAQAPLQRAHSLSSSGTSSLRSHARSSAPVPSSSPRTQTRKRLSLSFPILPANSNLSPRNVSPASSPAYSPSTSIIDISQLTPDDPMAFLTALAAQERRVLELKEELGKAETELGRLKRQWAVHEATKKLHGITPSGTERLRPLNTSIAAEDRGNGISSPTREQYQARKATLNSLNGTSNRKVLPSQRHQRTLSLLATNNTNRDRDTYRQPFPQPVGLDEESSTLMKGHTFASPSSSHSASSSISSQSTRPPRPQSLNDVSSSATKRNSQDVLIRTGKQIAEDFKEGLWTFIEDLRQATVGDEAISSSVNATGIRASPHGNATGMVRSSSKTSTRSNSSTAGKAPKEPKEPKEESLIDFGDSDNDTLSPSRIEEESLLDPSPTPARWSSSSTALSSASHSTVMSLPTSCSSTPRTSTRFASFFLPLLPLALPTYLRLVFPTYFRRIWTKSCALLLIMQFHNIKRALESSVNDHCIVDTEENCDVFDYTR